MRYGDIEFPLVDGPLEGFRQFPLVDGPLEGFRQLSVKKTKSHLSPDGVIRASVCCHAPRIYKMPP